MTVRAARAGALLLFFAWLAFGTLVTANNDDLAHAKELYFSAAYDEALAKLNGLARLDGLKIIGSSWPEAMEVSEYRMFCLLALDRRKEAEEAIELIIKVDPFYQPSDTQVSPRIVAVFQDVRRSLLPAVLQRFYADAKAAYGRKDPDASAQFDRVLALLAELDASRSPALADLHAAATGFRDLSKANDALIATPVASAAPAAAPVAAPVAAPAAAPVTAPAATPVVPRSSSPSPTGTPIGGDMTVGVQAVLRQFQRAYSDLNVSVAKEVWPSLDEKTLSRAFDQLEQQDLVFDGCRIEVTGIRAVATCEGHSKYVPKVGSKAVRLVPGHWTFSLEKAQDEWMIRTVKFQ